MPSSKPKVFVGSSSEQLDRARAIQQELQSDAAVTLWNQGIFSTPQTALESLAAEVSAADFAIFLFSQDDILHTRGVAEPTVRANVLFEFGFFAGALGRERTFIVAPSNTAHMPSDLLGIAFETYDPDRTSPQELRSALGPACTQIRFAIQRELSNRSRYVSRYLIEEEPSLPATGAHTVSLERAYKLLLYMFRRESFQSFRAFDLAFHRWEELLHSSTDSSESDDRSSFGQALNVSSQIFDACDDLFKSHRCQSFRRILVVDANLVDDDRAILILTRIADREAKWRLEVPTLEVETRVLKWTENQMLRKEIAELHDFAAFSDDNEYLAIVESTLTAPEDKVKFPLCDIHSDAKTVRRLSGKFDNYWRQAIPLDEAKRIFSPRAGRVATSPRNAALELFQSHESSRRLPYAVIVETAYVDLRNYTDLRNNEEDRAGHVADAMWLYHKLLNGTSTVRDHVLTETFINDFGEGCGGPYCDLTDGTEGDPRQRVLKRLKDVPVLSPVISDAYELFWMKNTRNRITERIKTLLTSPQSPVREEPDRFPVEIVVDTHRGPIVLAHRADNEPSRIVVRCAALMAQHYYDLYQCMHRRDSLVRDLWIFDFNRETEVSAVDRGAAAAAVLFEWPRDIRVHIANVMYFETPGMKDAVQLTTIPEQTWISSRVYRE